MTGRNLVFASFMKSTVIPRISSANFDLDIIGFRFWKPWISVDFTRIRIFQWNLQPSLTKTGKYRIRKDQLCRKVTPIFYSSSCLGWQHLDLLLNISTRTVWVAPYTTNTTPNTSSMFLCPGLMPWKTCVCVLFCVLVFKCVCICSHITFFRLDITCFGRTLPQTCPGVTLTQKGLMWPEFSKMPVRETSTPSLQSASDWHIQFYIWR